MKTRIAVLIALIAVLVLGSVALAQAAVHNPIVANDASASRIGDSYQVTGGVWQARRAASGGPYRLLDPAAPALTGNGCCCLFLPCVMR